MFLDFLLLVLGFAALIFGGDWLVDGSSSVARRFGLAEIIIGLTIVAFGTSAPELFVNVIASFRGNAELVVGNIVGSNIANLALNLGVAGLVGSLAVSRGLVKKEIPISLAGVILIWILAVPADAFRILERWSGAILLVGFAGFLWLMWKQAWSESDTEKKIAPKISLTKAILLILVGIGLLAAGGEAVVRSATSLASNFGVSESLVALTLVALGTSLPELVTSVIAAKKGKADIAIGNAIGSNIFNIFWVLGLSAVIRPVAYPDFLTVDLLVLAGVTILLAAFCFLGKKFTITRWNAAVLLAAYAGYVAFIFFRG